MEFFEMKFDETFVAVGRSNGYDTKEECRDAFQSSARALSSNSWHCKNAAPLDQFDCVSPVKAQKEYSMVKSNKGALINNSVQINK